MTGNRSVPQPIKIDGAFDDPGAIRALVQRHGPYPSIASYLPHAATRGTQGDFEPGETLPWFRGNWAVNGRALVAGADAILCNPRFIEAASRLFDTPNVKPTTVVVNVNAPMPAGAVHVDIASFRGANRDAYPLALLQAMGTSGLFEPWRVVEAGAISWFYEGPGGSYDYWPEGLDGPLRTVRPPFHNVALVADNDRMYHRIGWIGDPHSRPPQLSASAEIRHVDGGWTITDASAVRATYGNEQIRISVLWKAQVLRDHAGSDCRDSLTPERVVEIISADLHARGIGAPAPADALGDETWINLVHDTYHPPIVVDE